MRLDEEITIKKQELDSMIAKDNTAYWNRTGDNFDKDVTRLRNELNELERKRDANCEGGENGN